MTRIDRRALFATGSAAALLAAAGVSAEARPRRGGHLKAALSGGDRSETWVKIPGGRFLQAARNAVFESLTEVAADGTLQPSVAQRWEMLEDGRVWRFELAEGIKFHDGTLLEPEDVTASLTAHGLIAHGTQDVFVELEATDKSFPFRAARSGIVIFKAGELASGAPMSGSGLYRIRRFDPGSGFLGERVEKHRKDEQAGWFDTVELVSVSDQSVRLEALGEGIVDLIDLEGLDVPDLPEKTKLLGDRSRLQGAARTSLQMTSRTGPAPLDDLRFAERWWMQT